MRVIVYTAQEAIIAFMILLPVFWILNQKHFHHSVRSGMYLIFATYLCAVYVVVGLPDIAYIRFRPNINLTPFQYMFSDLRSTIPNVFLFLPLGFFLPILWQDFRSFWKTGFVGFLTSITIELLQVFTFRATDVNDLMTNTLGAMVGWCFGRVVQQYTLPAFPNKSRKDIPLIFGIPFAVMFLIHPAFSAFVYFLIK